VVVNGHGGNDGLIQAAAIKASAGTFQVAALSYWSLIRDALEELSERDGETSGTPASWRPQFSSISSRRR
jgi:creatinine amidohydrolase/Fe(II)-dependent formamide hydrolase-like protein